ncbi:unnamed protein product, partial [Phaeothamnion confervicola]
EWLHADVIQGNNSAAAASTCLIFWLCALTALAASASVPLYAAAGMFSSADLWAFYVYIVAVALTALCSFGLQGVTFVGMWTVWSDRTFVLAVAQQPYFVYATIWFLFSGYLTAQRDLNPVWYVFYYVNPATWTAKAILTALECGGYGSCSEQAGYYGGYSGGSVTEAETMGIAVYLAAVNGFVGLDADRVGAIQDYYSSTTTQQIIS